MVLLAILVLRSTPAAAQTGVGLVLAPWQGDDKAQLHFQVTLLNKTRTDNADARFHLERYDASGRWRESVPHPGWAFGFDTSYLNISTTDPVLPDRLVDQSVAAGFRLTESGERDTLWLVVGAGYAGSNPYGDSDALYGQASLVYTHPIDQQSAWQFVLNYDGNFLLFPDVPLPAVSYQQRVSDSLSYSIGFPINTLTWRLSDRLTVRATYIIPVSLYATVEYKLSDGWVFFGRLESQTDAFTVDGAPDHERIFFEQRRLEAGLRLHSDQKVDLTLAGGYAFDQEFSTGFDVRDLDNIAEINDEPYFRVAVDIRF